MLARRLIPLLAVAVAVPALPAAAQARGISVTLPKSITAERSFAYTWEGDTGLNTQIGGGFIVRVTFTRGSKACPANAQTDSKTIASAGGTDNVFHSGAFRGADQTYISRAGTVRVCGYISAPGDSATYEQLFTKTIKVKNRPRRTKFDFSADKLRDGTYNAGPADILGGGPTSSLSFVVQGGKVVSATAAGVPNTFCDPTFTTQTPIADGGTSTTPKYTDNRVIGEAFSAKFTVPTGDFSINAGAKTSKTIHGSFTEDAPNGSCRGGFGFIAKR
ncbi:MAG: hypothetical protein Q7T55_21220 [Solirubrobacteraceae bacterium]|nr:hypothetical protein [Solirubrobacteraceae bacterium]